MPVPPSIWQPKEWAPKCVVASGGLGEGFIPVEEEAKTSLRFVSMQGINFVFIKGTQIYFHFINHFHYLH
jgi:hypothetical protein